MNDELIVKDGRNVLRLVRRFAHPQAKVWRAVIEPERLSAWYPATVTRLDAAIGGELALDYGDGWTTTGVVTELDPPRVFAFTERALDEMPREGDGRIRIELRPDGDGCLMIFSQTFDDRPNAGGYAAGWHGCFDALDAALVGVEPAFDKAIAVRRHEHYVTFFGLDHADVERAAVGWTLRYIRHVAMQPVDVVWRCLAAAGEPVAGKQPPAAFVAGGVSAGAVTAVAPNALVEYETADGAVRWAFVSDPGGARIEIEQRGGSEIEPDAAAWRAHVEGLVARFIAETSPA